MTLNDIIVSALAQLDRGHDSQTVDTWRDKFTRYANEAVTDLAMLLQLRRTDTLTVSGGLVSLPDVCVKVLGVTQGGKTVSFATGPDRSRIHVFGDDGPAEVSCRYLPGDMSSPTDTPALPSYAHGLIVTYVVARERASQDPSVQRGANVYFELYNSGKRGLRASLGEPDKYQIVNRW